MLKRLVAQLLGRYVKGLGSEQVSARLLAGELALSDVELDLSALADALTGALPYTLEISRVACKSVSVKVPWQAPRRHPLCLEVQGCEVELEVRRANDRDLLALRTTAQREWLQRGAVRAAEQTERDEEDEQRQQRDVEAKLRVGLKEVIGDGLRASVHGFRLVLLSRAPAHHLEETRATALAAEAPAEAEGVPPASPSLVLALSLISTMPCAASGAVVDRPEDVYEVQGPCVRLHRLVELRGLCLAVPRRALGDGDECELPVAGVTDERLRVVAKHADEDCGPLRMWIEQQRLAGFIPQHRARRVCPFSSETSVGISIGAVEVRVRGMRLLPVLAVIMDAATPPFVPPEALPPELQSLHWRSAGTNKATTMAPAAAPPTLPRLPHGSWPMPAWAAVAAAGGDKPWVTAEAEGSGEGGSQDVAGPRMSSSSGLSADAPADGSSCSCWSEPAAGTGSAADLELREQLVNRRLARRVTVQLRLRQLAGEVHGVGASRSSSSSDGDGVVREKPGVVAQVVVRRLAFTRDIFFSLGSFERRCLAELNLLPESLGGGSSGSGAPDTAARTPRGGGGGTTPPERRTSRSSAFAAAADPSPGYDGGSPAVGPSGSGMGASAASANPGAGSLEEPGQPEFCINALTLGSASLSWCAEAVGGAARPWRPLLELAAPAPTAASGGHQLPPSVAVRWKELPPALAAGPNMAALSWQPVEGCVRGVRIVVDLRGWRATGVLLERCGRAATESLVLPPFESGWLRMALRNVQLEVPIPAASRSPTASAQHAGDRGAEGASPPGGAESGVAAGIAAFLGGAEPAGGPAPPQPAAIDANSNSTAGSTLAGGGDVAPASLLLHVPDVLLTSVPGSLGELFRALDVLPVAATWSPPRDWDLGEEVPNGSTTPSGRAASTPLGAAAVCQPAAAAAAAAAGYPPGPAAVPAGAAVGAAAPAAPADDQLLECACSRELASGAVRVAAGFTPVRGRLSARTWAARQGLKHNGAADVDPTGFVAMARNDFAELIRSQLVAEAGAAVLPQLEELHGSAAEAAGGELPQDSASTASTGATRKKEKKRKSHSKKRSEPAPSEVERLAKRWAELREMVRRLQSERTSLELRHRALGTAASKEVSKGEGISTARAEELEVAIALERARQAELSAQAEEQRIAIDGLLRDVPGLVAGIADLSAWAPAAAAAAAAAAPSSALPPQTVQAAAAPPGGVAAQPPA